MTTCTFCSATAAHQENTAPYHAFCGKPCQEIHYALIAAGGKRTREEEEEEEGVDFTQVLTRDVLRLILLKFKYFGDMINLCQTNNRMRSLCDNPEFQKQYLQTSVGKQRFQDYLFNLRSDWKNDITNLNTWIVIARELDIPIKPENVILISIKHNNVSLLQYALDWAYSAGASFGPNDVREYVDWSLTLGHLEAFKILEVTFSLANTMTNIKLEKALYGDSVELVEYLLTKDYIQKDVVPQNAGIAIRQSRHYEVVKPLISRNGAVWSSFMVSLFTIVYIKDELRLFFTKANPPFVSVFSVLHTENFFAMAFVVEAVQYLGDKIRGALIARVLPYTNFRIGDMEDFQFLVSHSSMTKDDKITAFSNLLGKANTVWLEWMVYSKHVDPSFDENYLYYHYEKRKDIQEFLHTFPQVRAKLLRETLPL